MYDQKHRYVHAYEGYDSRFAATYIAIPTVNGGCYARVVTDSGEGSLILSHAMQIFLRSKTVKTMNFWSRRNCEHKKIIRI